MIKRVFHKIASFEKSDQVRRTTRALLLYYGMIEVPFGDRQGHLNRGVAPENTSNTS